MARPNPAAWRSMRPDNETLRRKYGEWRRRADSSRTNTTDEAWLTVNKALRSKRRKVRDRWS